MEKWDAIVIGAGNGGLLAAATLADKGKKVLLLERHNLPGGFATSFKRGRFEFEASLHELCGFGREPGSGTVRKIFDELDLSDKVEWVDIPNAFRVISAEDGIDAVMPFGIEEFIKKTEELVPGSEESLRRLFDLAGRNDKTIDFFGDINSFNMGIVKSVFTEHMDFVRTAAYSVNDVLNALNVPLKAQRIFSAYWSYLGADLDNMSFIHYMSMVRTYLALGAVIPRYRSHEISCAIVDKIEKCGGVVRFNSPVVKILMKDGRPYGVKLADGTEEYTSHIISNASQHNTYGKLMDEKDVPEVEVRHTNARDFAVRGFSMFVGLDKSPEELGIDDHCYLIYDTLDTKKQFELMKNIETNNVQATVCLNKAIKDCSPEGTTVFYFTCIFSDDCWGKVDAENYVKTKQYMANKMIDNFEERTGIKIRDSIEEIEIATPMTYARYTDAPQGVIYGYFASPWDAVVPRTMMQGTDEKVPGLRFAGGFGTQLLGYSSAYTSGYNAANATLKDMEKEEEAK